MASGGLLLIGALGIAAISMLSRRSATAETTLDITVGRSGVRYYVTRASVLPYELAQLTEGLAVYSVQVVGDNSPVLRFVVMSNGARRLLSLNSGSSAAKQDTAIADFDLSRLQMFGT